MVVKSDRIIKIEAVLSELKFYFNNYNAKRPFVEVVQRAKKRLSEPDPRLNLSGRCDAKNFNFGPRKWLPIEFEDVVGDNFLPTNCQITEGEEDFYIKLAANEGHFATIYNQSDSNSCKLRYVATFEDQKLTTGLSQIGETHPFIN